MGSTLGPTKTATPGARPPKGWAPVHRKGIKPVQLSSRLLPSGVAFFREGGGYACLLHTVHRQVGQNQFSKAVSFLQ
jgi:hypothetical protein